jgi:hypothetical protein
MHLHPNVKRTTIALANQWKARHPSKTPPKWVTNALNDDLQKPTVTNATNWALSKDRNER